MWLVRSITLPVLSWISRLVSCWRVRSVAVASTMSWFGTAVHRANSMDEPSVVLATREKTGRSYPLPGYRQRMTTSVPQAFWLSATAAVEPSLPTGTICTGNWDAATTPVVGWRSTPAAAAVPPTPTSATSTNAAATRVRRRDRWRWISRSADTSAVGSPPGEAAEPAVGA